MSAILTSEDPSAIHPPPTSPPPNPGEFRDSGSFRGSQRYSSGYTPPVPTPSTNDESKRYSSSGYPVEEPNTAPQQRYSTGYPVSDPNQSAPTETYSQPYSQPSYSQQPAVGSDGSYVQYSENNENNEYGETRSGRPKTKLNIDLGLECVLVYLFSLISSIVILILEGKEGSAPDVRLYVRFHCFQSIMISLIWVFFEIIFGLIDSHTNTHGALGAIWWFAYMIVWILCMVQSFRFAKTLKLFKLPLLGRQAEKFAQQN